MSKAWHHYVFAAVLGLGVAFMYSVYVDRTVVDPFKNRMRCVCGTDGGQP